MNLAGHLRPAYFLYQFSWQILDWVFPPTCGGCEQMGVRWCPICADQVKRIQGEICPCCGELSPTGDSEVCHRCASVPPHFEQTRSCTEFKGPVREALHRLKYGRDIGLGDPLSKHLIEYYNELKWDIDFVTVVPLSKERLKERGYNQASFLARPFAYAVDKPYAPHLLYRKRNTRSQVGLNAAERRKNVADAFEASPANVRGKTVLVIDDVTTTGSTISACAQALRQAGASAVFGLTLARAVLQADADDQPTTSHTNGGTNGYRGRDLSEEHGANRPDQ